MPAEASKVIRAVNSNAKNKRCCGIKLTFPINAPECLLILQTYFSTSGEFMCQRGQKPAIAFILLLAVVFITQYYI